MLIYDMSDALTRTSILLLFFYMAWYMWDQREIIEHQREQIRQLQTESFYNALIIEAIEQQKQNPIYQKIL